MRVYSVGLLSLLTACSAEENETAQDSNAVSSTVAQTHAGEIITALQSNIEQDVPKIVREQESILAEIEQSVIQPMEDALLGLDSKTLATLHSANANIDGLRILDDAETVREIGEIIERRAKPVDGAGFDMFLADFSEAEFVKMEVHSVNLVNAGIVVCNVFFDFRARSHDLLRQDRGWVTLEVVKEDGVWKMSKFDMDSQEILTTQSPAFSDVTESSGLDMIPLFPRLEALRRGGYAITVGDVDSDGDADLYVGGWGKSQLYQNNGEGHFENITESANLGTVDRVKAAALVDLDNDGDKDFILSRFIDDKSEDLLLYLNNGNGIFEEQSGAIQKDLEYDRAMPLTVADFNNDAMLDLYVGFPGARDFTYLDAKPNAFNTHGLFINDGLTDGIHYSDATIQSGLDVKPSERLGLAAYPHASVKADFDGDGKVDLMIADDRRGVSQVFKNDGSASFEEVSQKANLNNSGWAMGVAVGDYDNDGLPDIYYSNIDFLAAKRISAAMGDDGVTTFHGNKLYRNLGGGEFEDVTEVAGVGWAGEATAGSMWLDYDNDGDLDLMVLNGLWTGPGDQDLSSLFNQAYLAEVLIERSDIDRAMAPLDVDAISLRNPGFNNMIIQTLTHFSGDLSKVTAKTSSDVPSLSLGGNQRHMMFRNNGDGSFTEVSYLLGLDSIDDGYMPAFADVNKDGKLDVLVRNCDPGTEHYQYPSLRLFENRLESAGNGLRVEVRGDGVNSNRDGVGTKVEVQVGDTIMVREIDSVAGASQSEMAAFFGLGRATVADKITITFPSGVQQVHENVAMGSHAFNE
jgi:hypothetical protein